MTLDDVSCLLHLPIDSMLFSQESMTMVEAIEMMIEHLGADPGAALNELTSIKDGHAHFSYLRVISKEHLLAYLEVDNEGDMVLMQEQTLCIYLLYLVGITLFTDKSAHYVEFAYLMNFRDLKLVTPIFDYLII